METNIKNLTTDDGACTETNDFSWNFLHFSNLGPAMTAFACCPGWGGVGGGVTASGGRSNLKGFAGRGKKESQCI